MSRKDYIVIVACLKEGRPHMLEATYQRLVEVFADKLKQDNANFDRAKFFDAAMN